MWVVVLALVITLLAARWLLSGRQKGLPPGPGFSLPFVGHLYLLPSDPTEVIEKWRKQYGNIYMLMLGRQPAVLIHEYSALHDALVKNHEVLIGRTENFITKTLFNNKGLVSLSGEAWKEQRAFVHSALRDLGMGKNVMAERIHEEIKHYLQSIDETKGEPTDLSNLISTTVCNIICGVVFGKRFSHKDEKFLELLSSMKFLFCALGSAALIQFFPFLKYLPGDYFLYHEAISRGKKMGSVIWEMINKDGRKININDKSFQDFVQAYLTEIEKKKVSGVTDTSIDDENLLATVWSFFVAGTESTSKIISFGLRYLVYFQDIQEKLFQEIKDNVGSEKMPQMSDKAKLKYLNTFILEVIRHTKLAPLGHARFAIKDVTLKGFLIPKGAIVVPVYDTLFGDIVVWGDPENFRPERFLGEVKKEFIPFSLGKRNCVGEALAVMELFLCFSAMIQRFKFVPEVHGRKPSLATIYGVTRTHEPFKVRAVPRATF